jgi:hypothetical protein
MVGYMLGAAKRRQRWKVALITPDVSRPFAGLDNFNWFVPKAHKASPWT